jgi:hypothetical protein
MNVLNILYNKKQIYSYLFFLFSKNLKKIISLSLSINKIYRQIQKFISNKIKNKRLYHRINIINIAKFC